MTSRASEKKRLKEMAWRVCRLRMERGLTQEELGAMAGVCKATIYRCETGAIGTRITTLMSIADALDTTMSDLLEGL